jgi:hypothetical protein
MPTTPGRGSRPPAAFRARGHRSWSREHVEWSRTGLPALITHSTPARPPTLTLTVAGNYGEWYTVQQQVGRRRMVLG